MATQRPLHGPAGRQPFFFLPQKKKWRIVVFLHCSITSTAGANLTPYQPEGRSHQVAPEGRQHLRWPKKGSNKSRCGLGTAKPLHAIPAGTHTGKVPQPAPSRRHSSQTTRTSLCSRLARMVISSLRRTRLWIASSLLAVVEGQARI